MHASWLCVAVNVLILVQSSVVGTRHYRESEGGLRTFLGAILYALARPPYMRIFPQFIVPRKFQHAQALRSTGRGQAARALRY